MEDDEVVPEPAAAPEPTPSEPSFAPETAPETAPESAPDSDGSDRRRPLIIIGIAVVVLLVLVVGAVAIGNRGSSSSGPALTLEPAGAAGENPFTDSVAIGKVATFPKEVRAAITRLRNKLPRSKTTQTLVATGTAPGVYAGDGTTRACDSQALVTYLRKNPGNATAWAKAAGVERNNIASFVTALTPVVLANDTRVTNHGYDNATVAPRQSILQAGTAVMVNATGTPRVVCNSGNPLSATRPIVITKTHGDAWSDFDPKAVTTIKPGPPAQALTLINTKTGEYYSQPMGGGSSGGSTPNGTNAQWVVAEPNFVGGTLKSTTIFAEAPGGPWAPTAEIAGEGVTGLAWGDGKWIAVTNADNGGIGNHILASTDLHTWTQVAALPNRLSGIAYGNGRWTATAVHYAPTLGQPGSSATECVIYTSTDTTHWTQVAAIGRPARGPWQPVAYGNGEWLTAVSSNDMTSGQPVPTLSMFTSKDGQHWTQNGSHLPGQIGPALAFDVGTWVLGATPASAGSAVVTSSRDAETWGAPSNGLGRGRIAALAGTTNGGWMAVLLHPTAGGLMSTFMTSTDAKTWDVVSTVPSNVSALVFRSGQPGPSVSSAQVPQ
jgi:hypothetical protein